MDSIRFIHVVVVVAVVVMNVVQNIVVVFIVLVAFIILPTYQRVVGNGYVDSKIQKSCLKKLSGCLVHNLVLGEIVNCQPCQI